MKQALGIDVGATGIKGAIVDLKKGVLISDRIKILTPKGGFPNDIADTIKQIAEKLEWKNKPIGIGFPAVIKNGVSLTAANVDDSFKNCDIKKLFSDATDCDCLIVNDADAAGIAETAFGKGQKLLGTVLLLTLGTGIGSALFRDGKLIPNTELGHLKYKDSIAEEYASNSARKRLDLSWDEFGEELNNYLLHVDFILNPDLIILGGGISKKYEKYSSKISKGLNVITAQKLNDAGIIGAAMQVK